MYVCMYVCMYVRTKKIKQTLQAYCRDTCVPGQQSKPQVFRTVLCTQKSLATASFSHHRILEVQPSELSSHGFC